jgi:hypothetical protein
MKTIASPAAAATARVVNSRPMTARTPLVRRTASIVRTEACPTPIRWERTAGRPLWRYQAPQRCTERSWVPGSSATGRSEQPARNSQRPCRRVRTGPSASARQAALSASSVSSACQAICSDRPRTTPSPAWTPPSFYGVIRGDRYESSPEYQASNRCHLIEVPARAPAAARIRGSRPGSYPSPRPCRARRSRR